MSLTIGEATAVNTVIKHLAGVATRDGRSLATRQDTIDALVLLTQGAYKALKTGYSPDDARHSLTLHWATGADPGFPVVTICGSMRFRAEMEAAAQDLTRQGFIVLMPFVAIAPGEQPTDPTKKMLDEMHRAKIDLSDSIHVVNPYGYIGDSTRGEIAYAKSLGKGISAIVPLHPDEADQ